MISDPKTTPDARTGRILYAALVASVGFTIQFGFYNSAGIILALILTAPTVPLFDRVFKDDKYAWPVLTSLSSRKAGRLIRDLERDKTAFNNFEIPAQGRDDSPVSLKGPFHETHHLPAE